MLEKKKIFPILALLFGFLFISFNGFGETLTVCKSGCEYGVIQNAIDIATPGDKIVVEEDTYKENLIINKDLTLTGEGKIIGKEKGESVLTVGPSNIVVKFEGINIQDSAGGKCVIKGGSRVCPNGVLVVGNSELILKNLAIKNNEYHGIRIKDNTNVKIHNTAIRENSEGGILAGNSSNTEMFNSSMVGNVGGVTVDDEADFLIEGSKLSDNWRNNLEIHSESKVEARKSVFANGATDEEYDDTSRGIKVNDNAKLIISNSELKHNTEYGIEIKDSSRVKITDTLISENRSRGILLDSSKSEAILNGSRIEKNWYGGIEIDGKIQISDSRIVNNSKYGVGVKGDGVAEISDSILAQNDTGVILEQYGQFELTDSKVSWSEYEGVIVNLESSDSFTDTVLAVDGTEIIENGSHGISFPTSVGHFRGKIVDSRISKNAGHGLFLEEHVHSNGSLTIKDVEIASNEKDGIYHENGIEVTVKNSNISDNGNNGFSLSEISKITIENTKIEENEESSLYSEDKAQVTINSSTILGRIETSKDSESTFSLFNCELGVKDGIAVLLAGESSAKVNSSEFVGSIGVKVTGTSSINIKDSLIEFYKNGLLAQDSARVEIRNAVLDAEPGSSNSMAGIFTGSSIVKLIEAKVKNSSVGTVIRETAEVSIIASYFSNFDDSGIILTGSPAFEISFTEISKANDYGLLFISRDCSHADYKNPFRGKVKGRNNKVIDSNVLICPEKYEFLISKNR